MRKKRENIHDLIKERFGRNHLYDERFTNRTYWDHINYDDNGNPLEEACANPDMLPESAGMWYSELTSFQADQLDFLDEAWDILSRREKQALTFASEGLVLREIGEKMGIKITTVETLIYRARIKIYKFHVVKKPICGRIYRDC